MRRNEANSHKRLLTFHPAHRSLLPEDVGHHISVQVKLWLKLQHVCTLFLASLSPNPLFFPIHSISLKEMPPKLVVSWYPGAEAAPGSWCLLGHHVTESVYAVTFKGTFEPILARFNIHMRHLTSSSHFVKSCGRWVRKCQVVARFRLLPALLVVENGAERLAATGPRKASVPPGAELRQSPAEEPDRASSERGPTRHYNEISFLLFRRAY